MANVQLGAVRTAAVNLVLDVLLAVAVVVLPAVSGNDTNWALVWGSVIKTAVATAVVGVKNLIERYRSGS